MPRRDPEPGAGHLTDQTAEETVMGEGGSQKEMTAMVGEVKTANQTLMEMETSVGRERTCQ